MRLCVHLPTLSFTSSCVFSVQYDMAELTFRSTGLQVLYPLIFPSILLRTRDGRPTFPLKHFHHPPSSRPLARRTN
ncbi:hypothetical protein DL96DRAFT_1642763 [Flagelloscypha sp. PMI_526]|nr:hypothetical protein DL96DRAFT_1642763 [Flagelloscypha sp. PMI_526]